ncbi:MAG: dUTP diphosphatase [Phycisphaerales bacterium]|nr:dUTP diphosphatase [Phycisphaerales bacterium]
MLAGGDRVVKPVQVKISRVGNSTVPMPRKMTEHSAGFDVSAALDHPLVVKPGRIHRVPCGFAMALPPGYEAQMRPRSGLSSKHGVTLINSPGTIDCDYRGEIQVPLINLSQEDFTVEPGMRIAQMVIVPVPPVQLVEVESLDETARGTGGFGHTGH